MAHVKKVVKLGRKNLGTTTIVGSNVAKFGPQWTNYAKTGVKYAEMRCFKARRNNAYWASLFGVVDNSDKGTSLHSWLNKNVNIAIT